MTQFHDIPIGEQAIRQSVRELQARWEQAKASGVQHDYGRQSLDANNERLKDNLVHLETCLDGARQQQWLCMDVFLHRYIDAERQRLASRLKLMEKYHIERHHNPYCERVHALFTELWQLTQAFLESADERHAQLVEQFHAEPTGARQHDVYQHRRDAEMCANVYTWLVESFGVTSAEEKTEQEASHA